MGITSMPTASGMENKREEHIADLFEDMRIAMGVTYPSDLRYVVPRKLILERLRQIDVKAYSLKMGGFLAVYGNLCGRNLAQKGAPHNRLRCSFSLFHLFFYFLPNCAAASFVFRRFLTSSDMGFISPAFVRACFVRSGPTSS